MTLQVLYKLESTRSNIFKEVILTTQFAIFQPAFLNIFRMKILHFDSHFIAIFVKNLGNN